ncbi:class II aldolase/adducin family protein [Rhodococcus hoagii]|nr:class II aldolase/adducin family protein [Prescottella equi]NKS71632.1 class II aldolase/adducin family protein [Prescottella equi]
MRHSRGTSSAHLADTATGLPIPATHRFDSIEDERAQRRRRLAGAMRLFGKYGFAEGISGHISVRDPGERDLFWVNPFGVPFSRVTVGDLICVDADGVVVAGGDHSVNPSAFAVHSEIHKRGFDGIAHGHTVSSRALGALGLMLEPVDQESAAFYDNQSFYSAYDGPAVSVEHGRDIADALGERNAILLRHHGLLTAGRSLEEAVHWFFTFESCAKVQLLARAAGPMEVMSGEQAELAKAGFGDRDLAEFTFQVLWEEIVHEQPDLLDE